MLARIISALVLISNLSYAGEVPARYINGPNGFMGLGLSRSCFALDIAADTIPCNPAFIAKNKKRRIGESLFLGSSVSYLKEATELSQGHADENSIQKLFTRHENNELQSQIEFGYWNEIFALSVTPARVNYNSSFRNQSLPEISLFASLEESAQMQLGSYLSEDWSFGIQFRYTHRRFVASQFFLTDVLLPDGSKWIEPKQQNLFFIEPAFLYAPQDNSLNPEFTLMLANSGYVSETYAEIPTTPQVHFTTSITPQTRFGRYSLGVDVTADKNTSKYSGPFSLGGFYEVGYVRVFGNLARQENGIGVGIFYSWWNLGITNRNEVFDNALGETEEFNKSYFFLGMEI